MLKPCCGGIYSMDGLAGDILGLSSFPQNLQRTEVVFLSKSKGSMNCKIWKLISSSWCASAIAQSVGISHGLADMVMGNFWPSYVLEVSGFMKGFLTNLKLHCAKVTDTTAKAHASSLVSDQPPCLGRSLLFHFFLVFSGIISHPISVSAPDAAHILPVTWKLY